MSNSILTVIEFVAALGALLFVHELGHYLVGLLFGIKAEEFGFGYPPKLIKLFSIAGTDFTLNLIPFGAFVRFKGENDPDVEGGLASANKWKRLGTLLSGPFMNILTGILLFTIVISQTGIPQSNMVQIAGVAPGSPAAEAGILEGDMLVTINSEDVDSMEMVSDRISQNLGDMISLTVIRSGEKMKFSLVPRENPPEGEGAIGILMQNPVEEVGFFRAIPFGGRLAWEQVKQIVSVPVLLIRGQVESEEARLLSPKGIYDVYSHVREEERTIEDDQPSLAFLNIAWFFGVISVALGFSNLLPIPALDGGRILFILPEIFIGKRVPPKYENFIHFIGYITLLVIMVYVFYQDFANPIQLR